MDETLNASLEHPSTKLKNETPFLSSIKWLISGGFGGACAVLVGHPFGVFSSVFMLNLDFLDIVKVRLQIAKKGFYTGSLDVAKKILSQNGFFGLYQGLIPPLLGTVPIISVTFCGYDFFKFLIRKVSGVSSELTIQHIVYAGFLSAIPATFVTAPFERVKIILQIQGQHEKNRFNGVFDVLRHLYKTDGIKSLFRGGCLTFARDGPGSAIYFGVYEATKRYMMPDDSKLSIGTTIMAGGLSGVAMWSIMFPIDTIKSTIQGSDNISFRSACTTLYRQGGIFRFFPGFVPAILRSFPANSASFLGVEVVHKILDSLF
ncbi:uncharacterized protein T551_01738 [Pneumocystis jirovecii RU7]|uniref:Uncharacterized protein n=1 Tax=Pneumocystis jirovecii (strain RU7) TaxID=1408657 RepID=A0A0W4ZQ03_PNEJ7|nr:uncharacterized protein T551_01738 [Pneumocystis jirovecii RU7]KTW30455.1 hypothetical protein T551_01738 [Pneumocystis jirovecii RU7]